jgi:enamine deaminase RidA (YjgF/YER057c/UK114 family)
MPNSKFLNHEPSLHRMIEKQYYSTGTKWEPIVGYSRALRAGNLIYVTGTTATDERGEIVGVGDAYAQTVQVIHNIERALAALGASLKDVVRTRIFVTDISRWEEYGRAHGEFFDEIKPCTTMVEVRRLIDDRMLVEIEADAVIATPLPH